jgi:hypothetical protein
MLEEKWLLIYLAPSYIRKAVLTYNSLAETVLDQTDDLFVEIYPPEQSFGSQKPFNKREQFYIIDTIRDWIKELQRQNRDLSHEEKVKIQLLVPPTFKEIEGANIVLQTLKAQLGIEPTIFSEAEETRQSFMGFKKNLMGYRANSRLLQLNLCQDKAVLVFGDLYRQDKIIQIDLGIGQIREFISSLRKTGQMDSLTLFVKANLYRFIEQARFLGKPQLACFDEHTSRLIAKSLGQIKTQRVGVECIGQLCSKIIDSDFQYLNNFSWIGTESLDYASAHLIYASFLLEGLGVTSCTLDTESRLKGFIIDKLIDQGELHDQFSGHRYDWRKSAQEALIRLAPLELGRSSQLALLTCKIFDSSHGWLHSWTEKEKKVLWLSAFFSAYLSQVPLDAGFETILSLQGISHRDCYLTACVIGLAALNNLTGQSKYLDSLPIELRTVARKMASIVQMAKALDVTGRSAVQNVKLEAKPRAPERAILKVFPRLNPAPEIIQVNILKRSFENQFEQKVEIEVANTGANSQLQEVASAQ